MHEILFEGARAPDFVPFRPLLPNIVRPEITAFAAAQGARGVGVGMQVRTYGAHAGEARARRAARAVAARCARQREVSQHVVVACVGEGILLQNGVLLSKSGRCFALKRVLPKTSDR